MCGIDEIDETVLPSMLASISVEAKIGESLEINGCVHTCLHRCFAEQHACTRRHILYSWLLVRVSLLAVGTWLSVNTVARRPIMNIGSIERNRIEDAQRRLTY